MQRNYNKMNIITLCQVIHEEEKGNLTFISGKWFYKDTEIKDIKRYLFVTNKFKDVDRLEKFIEGYKLLYGTDGLWPPLPILKQAINLINKGPLEPMAYPLNEKQLIIINYLLDHNEEVFFILTGVGGSGKSTFANIICQIFENDVGHLSLSELGDDFHLAAGITHRLIYSDELNSEDMDNAALKTLFSNQIVTINPKFDKPYQMQCQSAFFFSCNKPPRLDLTDTGMMRRIVYYKMDHKIEHPNPMMQKRKYTHDEIVNFVAHSLMDVEMTNWREKFEKETRDILVSNNSVFMYYNETYEDYRYATRSAGLKPMGEPNWREIMTLLKEWGYV